MTDRTLSRAVGPRDIGASPRECWTVSQLESKLQDVFDRHNVAPRLLTADGVGRCATMACSLVNHLQQVGFSHVQCTPPSLPFSWCFTVTAEAKPTAADVLGRTILLILLSPFADAYRFVAQPESDASEIWSAGLHSAFGLLHAQGWREVPYDVLRSRSRHLADIDIDHASVEGTHFGALLFGFHV